MSHGPALTAADGECVVWAGGQQTSGYGSVNWHGTTVLAHRLAFFLRLGRWPEPLARHLPGCRNRHCVLHVVDGTYKENARDQRTDGVNVNANKTHCPQGHEYSDDNTYTYPDGRRDCKACRRSSQDKYMRSKSA